MQTDNACCRNTENHVAYPALHGLGLRGAELTELEHQGYLEQDSRLSGKVSYWRLRFRFGGRLRTVYIGGDDKIVTAVREDLLRLRRHKLQRRQLEGEVRSGRRKLREIKRLLAPALAALGLHYHGDALRRSRAQHPREYSGADERKQHG